jgi:hypothetical protein
VRVCIYVSDEPRYWQVASAVGNALKAEGHEVFVDCSPQPNHGEIDLGIEIGGRTVGCNIGVPILHYIIDPLGEIPATWAGSTQRGHLFVFSDYQTHVRAHKQGVRVAEHVPLGWDMHPPQPTGVAQDYAVGFFGDPNPQAIDMLVSVLAEKTYKVGIWGNAAKWKMTGLAEHFVGEQPIDTEKLNEAVCRCRFVLDDPAQAQPGMAFLQACAMPATMGLGQYSTDRAAISMNGNGQMWTEHLFPDVNPCGTLRHFTDTDLPFASGKATQLAMSGRRDAPFQMYAALMEPYGYGINRMQDRWHYITWLFDNKQLYENAKGSCVQKEFATIQMDEPYASIQIRYFEPPTKDPSFIWYRKFDLDWSRERIDSQSLPTMLRVAARRIEQMLEANEPIVLNARVLSEAEGPK